MWTGSLGAREGLCFDLGAGSTGQAGLCQSFQLCSDLQSSVCIFNSNKIVKTGEKHPGAGQIHLFLMSKGRWDAGVWGAQVTLQASQHSRSPERGRGTAGGVVLPQLGYPPPPTPAVGRAPGTGHLLLLHWRQGKPRGLLRPCTSPPEVMAPGSRGSGYSRPGLGGQ